MKRQSPPQAKAKAAQLYESFYRKRFSLGNRCRVNDCARNRDYDPFCLCHLENRAPIEVVGERRQANMPAGLRNLGNTCYMNSYLQTVFHTLPIRRTLYEWRRPPPDRMVAGTPYEIAESLRRLFANLQTTNNWWIDPREFVKTAKMNAAVQQDVQEFSVLFMGYLDSIIAERKDEEKLRSLYKGRCRCTVTCRGCRAESKSETDIYDLALQTGNIKDVMTSLMYFFADEEIVEYKCVNCATPQVADKKTQLIDLPRYLNLHLLRFDFDRATGMPRKLTHAVEFPKVLDLRRFLSEEQVRSWGDDGCIYELTAILIHFGVAQGGHYISRIRVPEDKRWYTFNDERVTRYFDDDSATDFRDAYMLVYEKRRDVESAASVPLVPVHVQTKAPEFEGGEQLDELRRVVGKADVHDILTQLKAKPNMPVLWLPTNWLADVIRSIKEGPADKVIAAPELSAHLCPHDRVTRLAGLKAVDAKTMDNFFDALSIVPSPCYVDGSMFCHECAPAPPPTKQEDDEVPAWLRDILDKLD